MEITHLIIAEIDAEYRHPMHVSLDNPNIIDLNYKLDNGSIVGGIDVEIKTDDDLKVTDIVINGEGFVHFDSNDKETECTYNEAVVISHFEGLIYGCFVDGYTYAKI